MVMSQGTYTFLACFAGFWLVWALVVMLCCFCSFVQRRMKRRREQRVREHCLRSLEMEPLPARGHPAPREPPHCCPPHSLPPLTLHANTWSSAHEADPLGKPPCYEEAVLMEDPPPPYSEVLGEPRGGWSTKPAGGSGGSGRALQESEPSKPAVDRPLSSLIRLPVDQSWDSLGRLLSAMDLNRHNLPPPTHGPGPLAAMPGGGRTHSEPGLDPPFPLPTAFPLFGRSTAV